MKKLILLLMLFSTHCFGKATLVTSCGMPVLFSFEYNDEHYEIEPYEMTGEILMMWKEAVQQGEVRLIEAQHLYPYICPASA